MKKFYLLIFLNLSFVLSLNAQISGIINSYARVTAQVGTVLTLDNLSLAPSQSAIDAFGAGKKVMIIQMKGATINTSNTASFGQITDLHQAGNYELTEVLALVGVGPVYTITLQSLSRSYNVGGSVQLVSVPQYTDVEVVGTLTALSWNPTLGTGGVLTLEAQNVLTLSSNIDVSGQGFLGGQPNATNQASCNNSTTFVAPDLDVIDGRNQRHAQKGEGIVSYAQNGITGQHYGRGAIGNGGGGGNSHNGGGGGGSNLGNGGSGGVGWIGGGACSGTNTASGVGATSLLYDASENRLFLGGGGGGGQQNNSNASRGGNGGGIILVRANTLRTLAAAPTRSLLANGENAPNNTGNDGAGGGGAGGVIFLDVNNFDLGTTLQARTNGGEGGDVNTGNQHGGGGGGGIGAILLKNPAPVAMIDFTSIPGGSGRDCTSCTVDTGFPGGNNGGNTTQNGWQVSGLNTSLPISLLSFDAQFENQVVILDWATLSELNTDFFTIERTQDFITFERIGNIEAAGESNTRLDYTYTDEVPPLGLTYYRLKAVDRDATFSHSEWVSVKVERKTTYQVYPNPAREVLKVKLSNDSGLKKLTLYGIDGKMYFNAFANETAEIRVESLPRGMYILSIQDNHSTERLKVILE